ncbi:hypothetical protein P9265_14805 [Schinkia azotoformans]|uniref:hypothetical protein n=1 Tax=Schinkia azotoformans TaxID=1454 RepID=UPI002E2346F7|nr:hypothetical protein [Schinkia azotoformans]
MYKHNGKCYNFINNNKDGVIIMSPATLRKTSHYDSSSQLKTTGNQKTFSGLRKKVAKEAPFGKSLVEMYNQGK